MIEISLNDVRLYIKDNGDYLLKTLTKEVTLKEDRGGRK